MKMLGVGGGGGGGSEILCVYSGLWKIGEVKGRA